MIRPARTDDLPELLAILRDSPQAAQWSRDALAGALERCLVAEAGDGVVGFLTYLPIPLEDAELLNLAVAPKHRRSGAATRLVEALVERTAGSVFLEVRASNRAARSLYESLGFAVTAVRSAYYHRPVEDAYVMKRTPKIRNLEPMES